MAVRPVRGAGRLRIVHPSLAAARLTTGKCPAKFAGNRQALPCGRFGCSKKHSTAMTYGGGQMARSWHEEECCASSGEQAMVRTFKSGLAAVAAALVLAGSSQPADAVS